MSDAQGWPDGAARIEMMGEDEDGRFVARLVFPGTRPATTAGVIWKGEPVLLLTPAEVAALLDAARREEREACAQRLNAAAANLRNADADNRGIPDKMGVSWIGDELDAQAAAIRARGGA